MVLRELFEFSKAHPIIIQRSSVYMYTEQSPVNTHLFCAKRIIRTTKMRILTAIRGVSLPDHVGNESIRTVCNTQDAVRRARSRKRK